MSAKKIYSDDPAIAIHFQLRGDLAYKWSVENDSPQNMQIVLRAHGLPHTWEAAEHQLIVAKTV